MNAIVERKAQLVTGGTVAALIPQNLEETFRLAGAIAASGLAPNTLNTPEKIMVAIIAGAELGMPPFQSLQSFAVVNGRPTLWGDGLVAVVRSKGFRVREWQEGNGDALTAFCEVTRPDSGEVISRTFSVADAKVAKLWGKTGPWISNPTRMLQMRARGFACRDGAADVLRGFQLREEVEDYQPVKDVTPKSSGIAARLAQSAAASEGFNTHNTAPEAPEIDAILEGDDVPTFDAEPAQEAVIQPSAPQNAASLADRVTAFYQRLRGAPTTAKMSAIWAASAALRTDLDAADPDLLADVEREFAAAYAAMEDAEQGVVG
jgi:hypothetical protein